MRKLRGLRGYIYFGTRLDKFCHAERQGLTALVKEAAHAALASAAERLVLKEAAVEKSGSEEQSINMKGNLKDGKDNDNQDHIYLICMV